MTTYLHVTLEVRPGAMARFLEVMARAAPILESYGWRLVGAFVQRSGRLNTVIDLWELEDFNHFDRALQAFRGHPRFAEILAGLNDTVISETVVFADRAPYMR